MSFSQDNSPAEPSQENSTPTNFPAPRSGHVVALGVTLSLVGVLLIAGITFFTVRMRRARLVQANHRREEDNASRKSAVLDPRHPASHITPFSGGSMRIAHRRLDGAWDFEEPTTSFEPQGVADPAPQPTGASSRRSTIKSTFEEGTSKWDHRRNTNNSGLDPPPPAYHSSDHQSDEGYINQKD